MASSLRFHWRAHLGVVLGAAVGSAALIGALVVGDSVRESLLDRTLSRLGGVESALHSGDRWFERDLSTRLADPAGRDPSGTGAEPAWVWVANLRGTAARQDGTARAHDVQIYGVGPGFGELAPGARPGMTSFVPTFGRVHLNRPLAAQLKAGIGEEVILRFSKPAALSQDAVISPRNDAVAVLRLTVERLVEPEEFGDLSLKSGQRPALNAFVNPEQLVQAGGLAGRANLLLSGRPAGAKAEVPAAAGSEVGDGSFVERRLAARWNLADGEVEVRVVVPVAQAAGGKGPAPQVEILTRRVFLDAGIGEAARRPAKEVEGAGPVTNGVQVLTFLANSLKHGDRLTPYSMVSAAGAPWTPADLREDEIVVNDWLAEDLALKPGDSLEMAWFDPEAGARLQERTARFRVRAVVPLAGPYLDRGLMPEFPGLAKAESTTDWDAGFPLRHKLRAQDEAYWKQHRGTPKAFIHPAAGRRLWANRFGDATAIRIPVPAGISAEQWRDVVAANLRANLKPADVGLAFRPVRQEARRAATSGQDFGQLFIGFSCFVILAAMVLMGLLFQFGLEQRLGEVGTWLALGFRSRSVRRLWLAEGVLLAGIGGVLGVVGGLGYSRALIAGLGSLWRDAVAATPLGFHVGSTSLVIGWMASVIVAGATLALTLRRQFGRPIRELLAGSSETPPPRGRGMASRVAWVSGAAGLAMVILPVLRGETANAGLFFGAGCLGLVTGLSVFSALLGRWAVASRDAEPGAFTLGRLGLYGAARRRSRSLATAGLLAAGTFLILSIGVFRIDSARDGWRRDSGTGGFALIGESSLPISQDLNTAAGRESFGLGTNDLAGASFVPFRVRDGDDASCLNLDRAQRPRLLGVDPRLLEERGAFRFAGFQKGIEARRGWAALSWKPGAKEAGVPEIPAVGDAASIQWALGKKLGDALELTDERGRPFRLRLVGGLANSVLQGSLVIDEAAFRQLFPGEDGHRFFFVDAASNRVDALAVRLSRSLSDVGMVMTPVVRRLEEFNAVQNTYLSTFQVLGGLGLLLGSAGLGIVVLRNVWERRAELAVLRVVGFRHEIPGRLVLFEHVALLAAGMGIGVASAAVAVLPVVLHRMGELPVQTMFWTLIGVGAFGLGTAGWAVRTSLRGHLLDSLRGE